MKRNRKLRERKGTEKERDEDRIQAVFGRGERGRKGKLRETERGWMGESVCISTQAMQLLFCVVFMADAWAGALASDDDLLSAAATAPGPMAWAGIAPSEVSSSEAADNEAWADCCPSEVSSSEAARSQQNNDDDDDVRAIVPLLPLQE